jgi:hypothetical protein
MENNHLTYFKVENFKKFDSLESNPAENKVMAQTISKTTETKCDMDISTENVLASMTPTIAKPLYTNNSSLYTNIPSFEDDVATAKVPNQFYSMISPIDVLELLKTGYTGYKTNA